MGRQPLQALRDLVVRPASSEPGVGLWLLQHGDFGGKDTRSENRDSLGAKSGSLSTEVYTSFLRGRPRPGLALLAFDEREGSFFSMMPRRISFSAPMSVEAARRIIPLKLC